MQTLSPRWSHLLAVGLVGLVLALDLTAAEKKPAKRPTVKLNPTRVLVPNGTSFANEAWGFALGGKIESDYDKRTLVIVDLDQATPEEIDRLKAANHIVQCYFSVGTSEHFRFDYVKNKKKWKAIEFGPDPNWPDENWIDFRKKKLAYPLIKKRFLRAKDKGCHALELDNVDCYDNKACRMKGSRKYKIAAQIVFNSWQVNLAHSLGLAVSLKNAIAIVPRMAFMYDFAVNEQCFEYKECEALHTHFIMKGKAVLHHEYRFFPDICNQSAAFGFASKRCPPAKGEQGLCAMDSQWTDCNNATSKPLPPVKYTDGVQLGHESKTPSTASTSKVDSLRCPKLVFIKGCPKAGKMSKLRCTSLGKRLGERNGGGNKCVFCPGKFGCIAGSECRDLRQCVDERK